MIDELHVMGAGLRIIEILCCAQIITTLCVGLEAKLANVSKWRVNI